MPAGNNCSPLILAAKDDSQGFSRFNQLSFGIHSIQNIDRLADFDIDHGTAAQSDHPSILFAGNQVHSLDTEAGPENPIKRRRRSAALDMTEHDDPRLDIKPPGNLVGNKFADPAEPLDAQVGLG
jgi:hypothetical protein